MTARERAHGMIDALPEDSVCAVIQFMNRMARKPATPKMAAFLRLQTLRKTAPIDVSMDEWTKALDEKYGKSMLPNDPSDGEEP